MWFWIGALAGAVAWFSYLKIAPISGFRSVAEVVSTGGALRLRLRLAGQLGTGLHWLLAASAACPLGCVTWWLTRSPMAALLLGIGALTLPRALTELALAHRRTAERRETQVFVALVADTLRVDPALGQALRTAAATLSRRMQDFVQGVLAANQANLPLDEALGRAASATRDKDLMLFARLAAVAARMGDSGPDMLLRLGRALKRREELYIERKGETAGHGGVLAAMFLVLPTAFVLEETFSTETRYFLRYTLAGHFTTSFAAACEVGAWLLLRRMAQATD